MEDLNLGIKIKELRTNNKLSIRALAASSGITASMLSQIENDQVNPSINTLKSIAKSLGVPIHYFFKSAEDNSRVVKEASRVTIGGGVDGKDVRYELLTHDTNGEIEFCMMIIPPNSTTSKELLEHLGEEVAFMVSGIEIELEMEDETFYLRKGDSIKIEPNLKHRWKNNTKNEVQVLFAVTPPMF